MHVDPHPGNYRFGLDGRIGVVDFGCVKVLPEASRRNFVKQLRAYLEDRRDELRDRMVEGGILATDSAITVDEMWEWYADLIHEWRESQPVTFTPRSTSAGRARRHRHNRSAQHPFRRMLIPGDLVFFGRINLNINSDLRRATCHFSRPRDGSTSSTGSPSRSHRGGKQHIAWVRQRGLPFGLDPR